MCRGELDHEEIGYIIWDTWGLHIEGILGGVHVHIIHITQIIQFTQTALDFDA